VPGHQRKKEGPGAEPELRSGVALEAPERARGRAVRAPDGPQEGQQACQEERQGHLRQGLVSFVLSHSDSIRDRMVDRQSMEGLVLMVRCFVFFRFDMPAPTITPELKKDLEVLQVRSNF
jgi:hypothetical protein